MLIASTLRAPITGIAPMLGMIRETSGISAAEVGVLNCIRGRTHPADGH